MFKKLVATVTVVLGILLLSGCSSTSNEDSDSSPNPIFRTEYDGQNFVGGFLILVDKKTDIVYYMDKTSYKGGITPLYNKEGVPMNYEEYKELGYFYK